MPERIQAVGYHSCIVTDLVRGNLLDLEASALPAPLNEVTMARWIIFDRCADLLTPLMSQLTLEGRLDDLQATASRTGWLPPERDAGVDRLLLFCLCPLSLRFNACSSGMEQAGKGYPVAAAMHVLLPLDLQHISYILFFEFVLPGPVPVLDVVLVLIHSGLHIANVTLKWS